MRWLLPLALVAALGSYAARARLQAVALAEPSTLEEALPSLRALELMSLGYAPLVADYYWLRALNEFGTARAVEAKYPNLIALMRRVLTLDPYFKTGYFFAGTALTVRELDPSAAVELLEQGLRYRADDWRIPFLLGFNAYYFKGDYKRGAEALAIAAKDPAAPSHLGPLAARLAAEANVPELGIALIDSLLPNVGDEKVREMYLERRALLELELVLRELNALARRYAAERGRPLAALDELVTVGWVSAVPDEPLGGRFLVTGGVVGTSNEARRLRLAGKEQER